MQELQKATLRPALTFAMNDELGQATARMKRIAANYTFSFAYKCFVTSDWLRPLSDLALSEARLSFPCCVSHWQSFFGRESVLLSGHRNRCFSFNLKRSRSSLMFLETTALTINTRRANVTAFDSPTLTVPLSLWTISSPLVYSSSFCGAQVRSK